MPWRKCLSCGTRYGNSVIDGGGYAHVCGPLVRDAAGKLVPPTNPRNETVVGWDKDHPRIKAEGAGTVELDGPPTDVPLD